jgi:hypothetical protein
MKSYIGELNDWNESMNKKGDREFLKEMDELMKKMEVRT